VSQHIIVWFRQDLRLNDNPALESALNSKAAVIPVYINDIKCGRQAGAMGVWWRDASLAKLDQALRARGSRLIYRDGKAEDVLPALAAEVNASAVGSDVEINRRAIQSLHAILARLPGAWH
jgi:deoxyribodipyrimidine photo-lyase